MDNQEEERIYRQIPNIAWTEILVTEMRDQNYRDLVNSLPSIMQCDTLSGTWKIQFALDLLKVENLEVVRGIVWDALTILARVDPNSNYREVASLAWSIIDSFSDDDSLNSELCGVQGFLGDLRIFASNRNLELVQKEPQKPSSSRFETFTAMHSICKYNDIHSAGTLIVRLATDVDFVLRESSSYGIWCIYTRQDCDDNFIEPFRRTFSEILAEHKTDPHWYVRKITGFALSFEEE